MRRILLPMIAPSSLSAFSTGIAPSPAITRPENAVQVRAQSSQAPTPPSGGASTQPTRSGATPAPGQILPRGSLLDLSV